MILLPRLAVAALLAAALFLAPPRARAQEPDPDLPRLVLVLSWDGLRPDAIEKAPAPRLLKLIEEGAYCPTAQTVFPSATLPGHTSMLTGLTVEKHRVIWNNWVPQLKINHPTFLDLAADAGMEVAIAAGKEKFYHFIEGHKVKTYLGEAPKTEGHWGARELLGPVIEYLKKSRPRAMFIHFRDPDSAGHRHGWMSDPQMAAIRDCDEALGTLLAAIEADPDYRGRTTILLSADHGGHGKGHGSLDPVDMTIPWVAWGFGVARGKRLVRPVRTYDIAATALYLLGLDVPERWDGKPVFEALYSGARR